MPRGDAKKKKPKDSIGYDCINILVQNVLARVIYKAKNRARERERNQANPQKNRDRANAWRKEHPEQKKRSDLACYQRNKTKRKEAMRTYGLAHRNELYAQRKEARSNNEQFHAAEKLRGRIGIALRKRSISKSNQTLQLLGCSVDEFTTYMRRQLNIDESLHSSEFDHIFALNCYDLTDPKQQSMAVHFTNNQPLTRSENRWKSDKLPTKAMAAKVDRDKWPPGITEDMLPDIYPGWDTPLRMHAAPISGVSSSTDSVDAPDNMSDVSSNGGFSELSSDDDAE